MAQAFALLREHSPHLVQIIDASRQVVFQNETLRKLRLAANLPDSNKAAGQILHPEDREQSLRKLDLLFETGEYTDVVFRVRQLDGSYRAMLASAEPVRDASGRVSHAVAILVHIEAQLRAERERDEKSAFFEAVANVAGDLVLVIDTQGKIVYQNEALKKIRRGRGFADEQSWGQLIHPDDLELTRAAVAQGLAGAPRSALQYRVAGPGGGWRVLQANTQPILDDQGQPQFLAAVAIDITDQLEQEKKLRQMEIAAARADADQRLGAVLSQGVLGVAEVDLNGIIRSANQALCRLTGYTKDELIGRNWTLFYRPEDQAEFNQRLAVAA
ncbi:MAG: PAS domain S-box protein, partial [Quisquiliibacterium sp.]